MDTVLTGTLCLGSLIGLFFSNRSIIKAKKQIQLFNESKVTAPAEIIKYLQDPKHQKLHAKDENTSEIAVHSFVEGNVECSKPFKSIINKQTDLVYSYYYRYYMYSNDEFIPSEELKKLKKEDDLTINNVYEFNIVDAQNPKYKCIVFRNYNVNAHEGIELIASEKTIRELKWYEKFISALALLLELVVQSCKSSYHLRGVHIGWMENELGIRVDSPIVAFGEVVYNLQKNTLTMNTPLYFVKDKRVIIKTLKNSIFMKNLGFWALAGIFTVSGYFFAKKLWKKYKERPKQVNERLKSKLTKTIEGSRVIETADCLKCKKNPSEIVGNPCSHMSLCRGCYESMKKKICPICHTKISKGTQIFLS